MTKSRGRLQSKRGLVDKTEMPPDNEVWEPNAEDCIDDNYSVVLPSGLERLHIRLQSNAGGHTVGFAIALDENIGGVWVPLARADTAHGKPHVDLLDDNGKTIQSFDLASPIRNAADVNAGYDLGYAALLSDSRVAKHRETRGKRNGRTG